MNTESVKQQYPTLKNITPRTSYKEVRFLIIGYVLKLSDEQKSHCGKRSFWAISYANRYFFFIRYELSAVNLNKGRCSSDQCQNARFED